MTKSLFPVLALFLLTGCSRNYGQLTHIAELPKELDENSGIAYYGGPTIWFVEDSGNPEKISETDFKGNLLRQLRVEDAKNHDWEDLATDTLGNLYIGDFGNNKNTRRDLTIYKLPNPNIENSKKIEAEKIRFHYPDQEQFPPSRNKLYYDAEAFFHFRSNLYIITKNRADPFNGEALIYKVPDSSGTYKAHFIGSIQTCGDRKSCRVTSADISPSGKKIVLLGYGKLWVVTDFLPDDFTQGNITEIDLGLRTQLESVCFKDENILLLSDEQKGSSGRNLYSFTLKD